MNVWIWWPSKRNDKALEDVEKGYETCRAYMNTLNKVEPDKGLYCFPNLRNFSNEVGTEPQVKVFFFITVIELNVFSHFNGN